MIRIHAAAVNARLATGGRRVGDNRAPADVTTPYLVVYTDAGREHSYTEGSTIRVVRFRFLTHAIGKTPNEVRIAQEWARESLLRHRPNVAGWDCTPIRRTSTQPIDRDDDVSPPLYYGVDVWEYAATYRGD